MISALNLLWIAPVCMLLGIMIAALFAAGDLGEDWRMEKKNGGKKDED